MIGDVLHSLTLICNSIFWWILGLFLNIIDILYHIIKNISLFSLVSEITKDGKINNLYTSLLNLAIVICALFFVYQFIKKALSPEESPISTGQIVIEGIKCTILVILSSTLMISIFNFSSVFTVGIVKTVSDEIGGGTNLSNVLVTSVVQPTSDFDGSDAQYKDIDDDDKDVMKTSDGSKLDSTNVRKYLSETTSSRQANGAGGEPDYFTQSYFYKEALYNIEFNTGAKHGWLSLKSPWKLIFPVWQIETFMLIVITLYIMYCLFFATLSVAKREMEVVMLYIFSPFIFATSICKKDKRSALYESWASLFLQVVVLLVIINLSIFAIGKVWDGNFLFNSGIAILNNNFVKIIMKTILTFGICSLMMTGSNYVNKFIGSNASISSGKEVASGGAGLKKMAGMATGGIALGGAVAGGAVVGGGVLASKAGHAIANSNAGIWTGCKAIDMADKVKNSSAGQKISTVASSVANSKVGAVTGAGLKATGSALKSATGSAVKNMLNVASSGMLGQTTSRVAQKIQGHHYPTNYRGGKK